MKTVDKMFTVHMKFPIIFLPYCVASFLFPAVCWGSDSFADSGDILSSSRDRLIQEKLECMRSMVPHEDETRWDKICSTANLKQKSDRERREAVIDRALDALSMETEVSDEITPSEQESLDTTPEYFEPIQRDEYNPDQDIESPAFHIEPLPRLMEGEQEGMEDVIDIPDVVSEKHEMELGTEFYLYSYKEPVFNLEIKGPQYGIWGAYIYHPGEEDALYSDLVNMYKLDARFAFGDVDYSSDPSGELKDEGNHVFEIRGVAGYDHPFSERFLVTGYAGLGFRYLNNDSGGKQSTTGAYGYKRVSNYFYAPVGIEVLNQITPYWKAVSHIEWDGFMWGEQTSYLSDVNDGYPNLENDQKHGYGIRGAVRIAREGPDMDLFFEPFFRYWRIRDSEVATAVGNVYVVTGLEPDNNTTEYGIKFGLKY